MLAYKKTTCPTTECRENAYVALNLWPHKDGQVRNDDIRYRLGLAPIKEKLVHHWLRWFGHVQKRPSEAPVHYGVLSRDINVRRGKGRPKLT
jgi:hypothetical protein